MFFSLDNKTRSRCSRPQQKVDTIEFQIDESKISFSLASSSLIETRCVKLANVPRASPTLITFPIYVTLKDILKQKDFFTLVKENSSPSSSSSSKTKIYFELDGKVLDENTLFNSISSRDDLVLVIDDVRRLKFLESQGIPTTSMILEEFRKTLADRLPLDNGNRPTSSPHISYPNDSLDLLFDTSEGQLNYLTTYLLSHFGDLHEFTTYAVQKQNPSVGQNYQEWETGVYRMQGESNGTVTIALASDW